MKKFLAPLILAAGIGGMAAAIPAVAATTPVAAVASSVQPHLPYDG